MALSTASPTVNGVNNGIITVNGKPYTLAQIQQAGLGPSATMGVSAVQQGVQGPTGPVSDTGGDSAAQNTESSLGGVMTGNNGYANSTLASPGAPGVPTGSTDPAAPKPPAPHTPITPGAPVTPPPVDYGAAYKAALDSTLGGIEQAYNLAKGNVDTQEAQSRAALAPMPGQLNAIYNAAAASNARTNTNVLAQAAKSGIGRGTGNPAAQQSEITAAGNQNRATDVSSVPMLGTALTSQMQNERAQLDAEHMSAVNQVNEAAMGYAAQSGDAAANRAFSAQQANTNWQHQLTLANLANQQNGKLPDKLVPSLTGNDITSIRKEPAYSQAATYISQGMPTGKGKGGLDMKPTTLADLQAHFSNNPQLLLVLERDFPNLPAK